MAAGEMRWKRRKSPIKKPRSGKQTGRRVTKKRTRESKAWNENLRRAFNQAASGTFKPRSPAFALGRAARARKAGRKGAARGEVASARRLRGLMPKLP